MSSLEIDLAGIIRDRAFGENTCFRPERWGAIELYRLFKIMSSRKIIWFAGYR